MAPPSPGAMQLIDDPKNRKNEELTKAANEDTVKESQKDGRKFNNLIILFDTKLENFPHKFSVNIICCFHMNRVWLAGTWGLIASAITSPNALQIVQISILVCKDV